MNDYGIRIKDVTTLLKMKWKFIVLITILSGMISIILNFYIIKPTYEASTKVFIGKEENNNQYSEGNEVEMYQKLLKTYSEIVQSKDLVEAALNDSNIDINPKSVLDNINVTLKPDTQVLYIGYENKDKDMTKDIVESITNEFIKETEELVPNVKVAVIEKAELPQSPKSPKKLVNITISTLLGLIIGILLTFLFEYLNSTFNNKEKLENETEIPVIGVIPFEEIIK